MFKNPSFLFDIICTAAWIILVVRYARKGFLSSIVQLVGNLFSLLGAKELSAACAGWVFEHMLAGGFRTQIAANIAAGGAVDLSGIAEKYAGFLPASFRASIVAACERSIGAVLADNAVVLADGTKKSVGVILPAKLTFNTGAPEIMECVGGSCEYKLDGSDEWKKSSAGESFQIPANSKFDIRVAEAYHYICHYA